MSAMRIVVLLAAIVLICPLDAAEYPERLIRAIVPFAAGGSNDTMARLIAPELTKALGQQVIVENRPGAAGNIGIDAVAKSPPNGYMILFSATASTQNPALFRKLPYDPLRDIQPVAEIGQAPYVFIVNPAVPARTLQELINVARRNPGKLNAAAGGIGTRLASELFRIQNKLKLEIIPYQSSGQGALAVMTGEVDFVVMETSPVQGQLAAGKLRALAVAGEKRLKSFPEPADHGGSGLSRLQGGHDVRRLRRRGHAGGHRPEAEHDHQPDRRRAGLCRPAAGARRGDESEERRGLFRAVPQGDREVEGHREEGEHSAGRLRNAPGDEQKPCVSVSFTPVAGCGALHSSALVGVLAEYPDHPLRAIVPFSAGGSNDTMARIVSPQLSKALGQQVIVENRPGADARIGIEALARSAPDGYTILFSAGAVALIPALRRNVPYDPVRDRAASGRAGQRAVRHRRSIRRFRRRTSRS